MRCDAVALLCQARLFDDEFGEAFEEELEAEDVVPHIAQQSIRP